VRLRFKAREVWIFGFGERVADRVDHESNSVINDVLFRIIVWRKAKFGE